MKRDILFHVKPKMLVLLFVAVTLWLAILLQTAVERVFWKKGDINEAFSALRTEENIGTLKVTAVYPKEFLSEYDKKQLIYFLAEKIGLETEEEPKVFYATNRCEVWYEKEAVRANTLLKVISVHQNEADTHYLHVVLTIQEETTESLSFYQKCVERAMEELGAEQISVTLELSGEQEGDIPLGKKDTLTDTLLESLKAYPVYENRENSYYTVYAYTGLIPEYITVEGNKINVQVALLYDHEKDVTSISLATPIMTD